MADPHRTPGPADPAGGWLTPTAAAIAGFTIAVLCLLTDGAWVLTVQTYVSRNGSAAFEDIAMATGLVQGLLAGAAIVLARRGLDSTAPTARHLGGATVLLGALAIGVALLTIVAGLIAAT